MDNFNLQPFRNQWFSWERINNCFWPGAGRRSDKVDSELSPVRLMSGIYLIAWGASGEPSPEDRKVQYVGMTENFKNRMAQFAASSGLHYEERYPGHFAAWRWPIGKSESMQIGFYPLAEDVSSHIKSGLLHWYEALALDSYFRLHRRLPELNKGGGIIVLGGY